MRSIATAQQDNKNFTNLVPSPEQLNAQADSLEVRYNTRESAEKAAITATSLLRDEELAADRMIKANAGSVEAQSNGDVSAIKSSGHDLRATTATVAPMLAPTLKLTDGQHEGQLNLAARAIAGAGSYVFELNDDPSNDAMWKQVSIQKKANFTVIGLTPGKRYRARMAAIGSSGAGPWSEVLSRIVR